ncbi:MAG: hypothetical protein J1D77_02595 [Muribaculaceae bacterium]|nr:hypothetical protein [Muribaculaceae bacterium]
MGFELRESSGLGKTGVALAALAAFTMALLSFLFHPVEITPLQYGICLPSPDSWDFAPLWSWIVNTLLIGLIALLLFLVNKSYNFVRTTEPVLVALFLLMATSGPAYTEGINASVILCLANVVALGVIFDSYDSRNATREMFTLGILIGIGMMVQYAFFPMAFLFILWALFMKVLRIRETLAYIVGILCPYWIALGTGWLSFSEFHFPSLSPLFTEGQDPSEFFIMLIGIGLATVMGFLMALVNSIKLYAGNSKVNAMNLCVTTLGATAILCILFDFDNMHAYVTTLYLAATVQVANVCALWNPREPWLVTAIPGVCYIALFVCSLLL